MLDQIFRQSKDSLIAYNAKFINEGNTKLFYGPDFVFVSGDSQEDTAEKITERYCLEIQESGIENVQILSPFRSEGAASSEQLNETIRELSAALSDAGFGLQFADVAVDSTGKVFGSSIPLSGAAPIQQPMPDAAQRPVEASGAALRQSGGEVHARLERAPQSVVERRNAPARPTSMEDFK